MELSPQQMLAAREGDARFCVATLVAHPERFSGKAEYMADFVEAHLGIYAYPQRQNTAKTLTILTKRQFDVALEEASREHGIESDQILGRSREKPIIRARNDLIRTLHKSGWSATQIGRAMARDHTTILHSLKTGRKREEALRRKRGQGVAL